MGLVHVIRVVIADDQPLMRTGFKTVLEATGQIAVVAEADDGAVVEGARAAGVPITFTVEGAPRTLPAGLDTSAFRIVQEAVTKVIRHAGGAPASVTVHYGDSSLQLVVADDGRGGEVDGGHGLVGMRERVAAFGGTLQAGPRERGFVVRAELPYRILGRALSRK